VLLGETRSKNALLIKSDIKKKIEVVSLIPDEIETFPWGGHIGLTMLEKVLPVILKSKSSLIFANTRAMCEIWYQKLLELCPDLAGIMAMHHGSISRELRDWVEDALHDGTLKAVVCTSSLDLGVDFRPVETIIQIGSPKGIARFMQRAGRSGHQPGALSKIYFVPTHSLELVEGAAIREAIKAGFLEVRIPYIRSFDVLLQYLSSLAVSEGFNADIIYKEIKDTFCFSSIEKPEWLEILHFLVYGGKTLSAYDEYQKLIIENGLYKMINKKLSQIHKLSIGTIVSDASLHIKYISGKRIGSIEEWFISQLNPGDTFWFGGKSLELVRVKGMDVHVRKSNKTNGKVPSWQGGRMPLSSELSQMLRTKMNNYKKGIVTDIEIRVLQGLFDTQMERSFLPSEDEFLIEYFHSKEGHHLIMFPFEGRFVHEGLAALLAKRISMKLPISFSIAMNDYGLELLSDQKIDIEKIITVRLVSILLKWLNEGLGI
jgi:ATP-dependent Lhr-like helicase